MLPSPCGWLRVDRVGDYRWHGLNVRGESLLLTVTLLETWELLGRPERRVRVCHRKRFAPVWLVTVEQIHHHAVVRHDVVAHRQYRCAIAE